LAEGSPGMGSLNCTFEALYENSRQRAGKRQRSPKYSGRSFGQIGPQDDRCRDSTTVFGQPANRLREAYMSMTKVEAIIQPSKLESVKEALLEIGVEGMTILEVRGHGRQKGHTEIYRGREYTVDLLPKIKLELVLADEMVDRAVQTIVSVTRTGRIGDGKIFLSRIDDAIRIRNDERGVTAL